jgi:hypothetical protein
VDLVKIQYTRDGETTRFMNETLTNIDNELYCYSNEFHSHLPFDRLSSDIPAGIPGGRPGGGPGGIILIMGRWPKFIMCAGRGCLGNPGGGPGGTIPTWGVGVNTWGPSSWLSSVLCARKVINVRKLKKLTLFILDSSKSSKDHLLFIQCYYRTTGENIN